MSKDWNKYLQDFTQSLEDRGYRKYHQNIANNCDYSYYKSFDGKYQIGVLIYDWRKYEQASSRAISWSYECMPIDIDGRIDLVVSDDSINIEKFEEMSETFYTTMGKYFTKED